MADYIDREELLKKLYNEGRYFLHYGTSYFKVADIKSVPSVDAVEVVRCKDCKYRHENFCYKLSIIDDKQNSYYLVVNDNDYCKWGEKNEH